MCRDQKSRIEDGVKQIERAEDTILQAHVKYIVLKGSPDLFKEMPDRPMILLDVFTLVSSKFIPLPRVFLQHCFKRHS